MPKGDALGVARIAGIMGAKRTPDLIPLCHPIALHGVKVTLDVVDSGVEITARVKTADRTGVEMEALTAVTVAALALIDMVKAVDPGRGDQRRAGRGEDRRQDRPLDAAMMPRRSVITVSNRAAAGMYEDTPGRCWSSCSARRAATVDGPVVVPDGEPVEAALRDGRRRGLRRDRDHRRHRADPDGPHPRDDPHG